MKLFYILPGPLRVCPTNKVLAAGLLCRAGWQAQQVAAVRLEACAQIQIRLFKSTNSQVIVPAFRPALIVFCLPMHTGEFSLCVQV